MSYLNETRVPAGSPRGGEWTSGGGGGFGDKMSPLAGFTRSQKAQITKVLHNKERNREAVKSEQNLVRALNGNMTPTKFPVDVLVMINGKLRALEVKTFFPPEPGETRVPADRINAKDKIYKIEWQHKWKAPIDTIVVNRRTNPMTFYFKAHHGGFRMGSMIPVNSLAHLKELLGAKTLENVSHETMKKQMDWYYKGGWDKVEEAHWLKTGNFVTKQNIRKGNF